MLVVRDLPTLRDATARLRAERGGLAFVPTMGALHAGHLALVAAGKRAGGAVAASIFVNPLQFGPNEDLARYPRDEEGDLDKLRAAGCDLAWLPDVPTMYPEGAATTVTVDGPPAALWEAEQRPGHFRGVATVCCKLFSQVEADLAFFGEKDWQQVQVVSRMVRDLDLPLRIVPVPTVREPDGLALSSRNRFLAPAERALAPALHAAMQAAVARLRAGEAPAPVLAEAAAGLVRQGFGAVDYLALVEAATLRPLAALPPAGTGRLLAAARLGAVRLLDNLPV
ncbi:pantoate--beta-alanine ligase [Roseomonas sp. NAR14]|uniref:Pantothenate synthetase n=1 Tax=Roseomonas acroporae TaxID=2937791 RepID=A0A9X2BSQ6_9PROT|nr:pantoate--beta-alanine ligase [Roseomonas acroporae]MCK8783808.1 pantoate--beta-alanine ligase [Roseomonas acroporae]